MEWTILRIIACTVLLNPCLLGVAQGAGTATIARGTGAGSEKATAFIAHFLRQQVSQDKRFDVLTLEKDLGSPGLGRATKAFASAQEMTLNGFRAFQNLDIDEAVDLLNAALNRYEKHAAYVTDFRQVADILLLLGACHFLRGEEKIAKRRMAQAALLFPSIKPDPEIYNESMRAAFDATITHLRKRKGGDLSITSNPSYGEVYIDGKFAGVTPALLEGIAVGRHYVRVYKEGYRSWGKVVGVVANSETIARSSLKPTAQRDTFAKPVDAAITEMLSLEAGGDNKMPEVIEELGVALAIDDLFLAHVKLEGERVNVLVTHYNLNTGLRVGMGRQKFSYDSRPDTYRREMASLLERDLIDKHSTGRKDSGEEMAEPGGLTHAASKACMGTECATFKFFPLGVGFITGAVLMGTGGLLWGLAKSGNSKLRLLQQTNPEVSTNRRGPHAKAVAGDVLFFTGAGVAVVSGIAALLWHPQPTPKDVAKSSHSFGWGFMPLGGGGILSSVGTF